MDYCGSKTELGDEDLDSGLGSNLNTMATALSLATLDLSDLI